MNFILIGVFQEMFTIPSILVQPVLLSLKRFVRMKFKIKLYNFCTTIISLIAMV